MRPYRIVLVSVLFAAGFHSSCSREGGVSTAGIRRLAEGLSREFVERKGLGCQALQELDRYSQCLPNVPGKMYDYGNHVAIIVIKDGWIVEEWYSLPESMFYQQDLASNDKSFWFFVESSGFD